MKTHNETSTAKSYVVTHCRSICRSGRLSTQTISWLVQNTQHSQPITLLIWKT